MAISEASTEKAERPLAWSPWHKPVAIAAVLSLLVCRQAHAAGASYDLGPVEAVTDIFLRSGASWENALKAVALTLFQSLVVIEIVWTVGLTLIAGADLLGLLAVLLRQLIVIGFFYWLLLGGATYPLAIINSFGQAAGLANAASGGNLVSRPEDIVSAGISLAAAVWNGFTFQHPGLDFLLAIAGMVILCVMVGAAATLVEVLVEAALVAYAGLLLLGFGATAFTRDYAINYLRWAVSIGLKKMFVLLILGLGIGVIQQLAAYVGHQASLIPAGEIGVLVAVPLLFWRLADKLPYKAQELVAGASSYHPLNFGAGLRQSALMAAAATTGAVGAASAAGAAFSLAQQQLGGGGDGRSGGESGGGGSPGGGSGGSGGGAGSNSAPGFGATARQAARNLRGAMGSDVGMRMTGDHTARLLNSGWRMARGMSNQRGNVQNDGDAA